MKALTLFLTVVSICSLAVAAPFDARAAFDTSPGRDVDAALKRAEKDKKRVFLVSYDPEAGGNFPGLDIKYFTDLQETKKILKDNFIIVLLTKGHKDLEKYKPEGNTEKPYFVVINPAGDVVKSGAVYGNPTEGLKIVKELVALP